MAGHTSSRDTAMLVLAGIMAACLAVALVGGLVAIVRFGQPDGATATLVAETAAWMFAAAFLVSFFLAVSESLEARNAGH